MSSKVSSSTFVERNKQSSAAHEAPFKLSDGRPRPEIVVVACCDSRFDPATSLGIKRGEAIIFRTVGARVSPVLDDIVTLDAFLTLSEIMVIRHTDCGALYFTDEVIREKIKEREPNAQGLENRASGAYKDVNESLKEDFELVRKHPFMRKELAERTTGYLFDFDTGKLELAGI